MYQKTASVAATVLKTIRVSGVIAQVEPNIFLVLLDSLEMPLIIIAKKKALKSVNYRYMTSYKGFVLFTETKQPLQLPEQVELVEAENIWIPGF